MREILFRGQIARKGEAVALDGPLEESIWAYGGVYVPDDSSDIDIICDLNGIRKLHVYPDTVSQYTGMKDLNGTKIFEGDIVNAGVKGSRKRLLYTVGYDDAYAAFWLFDKYNEPTENLVIWSSETQLEVIGNKWDNPELLNEPQRSKPKNKDMER